MAEPGWLTYDDFAGRVGEPFVLTGSEPLVLELVEASVSSEAGGQGPGGQQRRQFSLVFRGPAAPTLRQGTYPLQQADGSVLDLFLVPLGPDAAGMRYEAAFA